MPRRPRTALLAMLGAALLLAGAGCSGKGTGHAGGPGADLGPGPAGVHTQGGNGNVTTTTSYLQGEEASNLTSYMNELPNASGTVTGAAFDSPAAKFASVMADLELNGTATTDQVGSRWEVCGTEWLSGCLRFSDFQFDSGGQLQSFSVDGDPVDSLVYYDDAADPVNGDLATVGPHAYLSLPSADRLIVFLSYSWNTDVQASTTGCYPEEATYDVDGGSLSPTVSHGGGPTASGSASPFDNLVMGMAFPSSHTGGTVNVPCKASDGSSDTFHIGVD